MAEHINHNSPSEKFAKKVERKNKRVQRRLTKGKSAVKAKKKP